MINFSNSSSSDCELIKIKLGRVFLYKNYVVAEFNEGVDINYDNFQEVTEIIKSTFGSKSFGFVANRVNSYSIDLTDATKFNKEFPNLRAFAIVVYNSISERVFEIENHFFEYNREVFKDLNDAKKWVSKTLSLNI